MKNLIYYALYLIVLFALFIWSENIAVFVAGFVVGASALSFLILHFFEITKKKPYSWACTQDNCNFSIAGYDAALVAIVSEKHEQYHMYGDAN